jgi:transposase-like protein
MDTEHRAITEPVRRIEVFTGAGRRRTWSDEDKARIVAESFTAVSIGFQKLHAETQLVDKRQWCEQMASEKGNLLPV